MIDLKVLYRNYKIPIICIFMGLIIFSIGIVWQFMNLFEYYQNLDERLTTGRVIPPYDIASIYFTSLGIIIFIFGVALLLYLFGVRNKIYYKMSLIAIIIGFIISFITRIITIIWHYKPSLLLKDNLSSYEYSVRILYKNIVNTLSDVGLFIMFVIICFLLIEILNVKPLIK